LSINYRLPAKYDVWILGLVISLVFLFVTIQIVFSQTVTAQSIEALDLECRTNYHSYCFGAEWDAIVDKMNTEYISQTGNIKTDIDEDESILCLRDISNNVTTKGDLVCAELDWLDFLNETQEQKINEIFSKDLDTFNAKDLIK